VSDLPVTLVRPVDAPDHPRPTPVTLARCAYRGQFPDRRKADSRRT